MAPRVRFALLTVTALLMVPGPLVGVAMGNDASAASASLSGGNVPAAALVAVPVKSPVPAVPRGLPQAAVFAVVVTAVRFSTRRRSLRGLAFRLGDVGDRWRALLFGAPPSLL